MRICIPFYISQVNNNGYCTLARLLSQWALLSEVGKSYYFKRDRRNVLLECEEKTTFLLQNKVSDASRGDGSGLGLVQFPVWIWWEPRFGMLVERRE